MNKNLDVITHAVALIIKAAIIAARFSGRVRKRSLKRLAAMDADTKDKEILFLKDKAYQLEKLLNHQLNTGKLKISKNVQFLPGTLITFGLLTLQWFYVGGFGQYISVL